MKKKLVYKNTIDISNDIVSKHFKVKDSLLGTVEDFINTFKSIKKEYKSVIKKYDNYEIYVSTNRNEWAINLYDYETEQEFEKRKKKLEKSKIYRENKKKKDREKLTEINKDITDLKWSLLNV